LNSSHPADHMKSWETERHIEELEGMGKTVVRRRRRDKVHVQGRVRLNAAILKPSTLVERNAT